MLSFTPLKNSLENEFGGKLTFDEGGRISLNMPDGSSQELLSGASVQEDVKTNLGDGLKLNTNEDLIKIAEKISETTKVEVIQNPIPTTEVISGKASEELDFAEAFEDEKPVVETSVKTVDKEDIVESENILNKTEEKSSRNIFKPLENAVSGSEQENFITSTEAGSLESSELVSTMTLAEAKAFDRPLNSVELAKNLAQQGDYINLRNVPSISPEVLKTFYNQGDIKDRVFNFLGLKPEFLNREAANLIKSFGNQVILSDEVLRKVEDLTTS
jgi:hypothetical protein